MTPPINPWHHPLMTTGTYTSGQIVSLTGVGIRTFRHWIGLGILPGPHGRGPAARYGEEQVDRVRAIQALRAQGAKLDEIKRRISTMTPQEMASLIPPQQPPRVATIGDASRPDAAGAAANDGVPSPSAPVGYRATPWEAVELIPGLLLMVGQNRGDLVRRLADEIWRRYGSAAR